MFLFQEREIRILVNLLPDAEIASGNIVYANFILQLTGLVSVSGHADCDNIRIARIVQNCVCVMDRAIDSVRVDVLIIGRTFGGPVCHISIRVKFYQFIPIPFVFYQNRIRYLISVTQ